MTTQIRDATTACPCTLCVRLGQLIGMHQRAIHEAGTTRAQVEAAGRQVDRRHHLPSAHDDWTAQPTARQPK